MSEAFVKLDLHGMTRDQAIKAIDRALSSAGSSVYQIRLVHGHNRGAHEVRGTSVLRRPKRSVDPVSVR